MTRFKWINRWITADLSGIHIILAGVSVFLYIAGYFIPSSRLMTAGYAGLYLVILFYLLHLQLHSCDSFLSMHPATDQIPKSQMKLVNGVYMAVFLAVTGAFMAVFSLLHLNWLVNGLKSVLTAILRFLASFLPEAVNEPVESMPSGSFIPPELGEEAAAPSLIAKILDAALTAAAVVFIVLLAVYLLRQLFFLLIRLLKPREDGDEKEFMKPAVVFSRIHTGQAKGTPLWRDFTIEGRIRRAYKKEILRRLKVRSRISRTETPEELEHKSGFPEEPSLCGIYDQVYEKARYGNGCTKEDLERLNEIRRSNQKNTESKYKKTREE
ncbi:sodium:solute symporter [Hungatella sp. SB206]|uniref:sodium:solute symporter n=1 Tax=Hungatella sp. SB206 TaxID=2937758 RepID=UPI003DAA032B